MSTDEQNHFRQWKLSWEMFLSFRLLHCFAVDIWSPIWIYWRQQNNWECSARSISTTVTLSEPKKVFCLEWIELEIFCDLSRVQLFVFSFSRPFCWSSLIQEKLFSTFCWFCWNKKEKCSSALRTKNFSTKKNLNKQLLSLDRQANVSFLGENRSSKALRIAQDGWKIR